MAGRLLLVGGPYPGLRRASHGGHVSLVGAGRLVAPVGAAGRYSVTVPEGLYVVTGRSPQYGSGTYECEAVAPVRVVAGRTTLLDVYCPLR